MPQACNHFRLYNGKAAEQELRTLQDQTSSSFTFGKDLIEHNLVVFRNGEGALQVLCLLNAEYRLYMLIAESSFA